MWSSELPSTQGERQKDHISSYDKVTQRKRVKYSSGHSLCRQCVKKYNTILASKTDSELEVENTNEINDCDIDERDEPEKFSCVTPRKRLNTSLKTMGISPVNLHGIAQHNET